MVAGTPWEHIRLSIKAWRRLFGAVVLLGSLALSGCTGRASADSSLVLGEVYTSVALTIAAAASAVTPTASLTAAATPSPSSTPTVIPTATASATSASTYYSYASGCDNAAYAADVTIADGSELVPGQAFTKTWEILNTGSCDWNTHYSIVFMSGNDMSGAETAIDAGVSAGEYAEVSVALTAPEDEGTYTGYWSLANASGMPFGQQVYVQIVVAGEAATSTPTPTTEAATATATGTPVTPSATSTLASSEASTEQATATPEGTPIATTEARNHEERAT